MTNQMKLTHGLQNTDIDVDGVTRIMSLGLYEGDVFALRMTTKLLDNYIEPMITEIKFTEYGIFLLRNFLNSALDQIDDYPVKSND